MIGSRQVATIDLIERHVAGRFAGYIGGATLTTAMHDVGQNDFEVCEEHNEAFVTKCKKCAQGADAR